MEKIGKIFKLKFFKLKIFRSGFFWAVISGLLTSLTINCKYLFFLTWISLIPFCYFLYEYRNSVWRCYLTALIWGLVYYTSIYTWFLSVHPLTFMGLSNNESLLAAVCIWLSVSIAQAIQLSAIGLIYGLIKPRGVAAPLVLGGLWVILEWAQGYGVFAMNWSRLALSQYFFLPNIQIVSLFGSLFLTLLIVCVNGLIALYFWQKINNKISFRPLYIAAAAIVLINMSFGLIRYAVVDNQKYNDTVKIAAIQGDFPSAIKWETSSGEIFNEYFSLSEQAVDAGAKIILWPETTITNILSDSIYDYTLSDFSAENNVYLFIGGYSEDEEANLYNSIIAFYPSGEKTEIYNKRQLVPFGEFLPYESFLSKFEVLKKLNLSEGALTQGEKGVIFKTEYGNFNGLICFDSLYQRFSYNDTRNGAQALFLVTNDSWYMKSQSIDQHFGHAVLRSVENNRWLVRAANAGISGIISASGKTIDSLSAGKSGYVINDVPLIKDKTLYTIIGDAIAYISLAGVLGAFIFFKFFDAKKPKKLKDKDTNI